MSASQNPDVIGVDLGGTNLRAAVIDRMGQIVARRVAATPYEDGAFGPPERLIEAIIECVRPLLTAYPHVKAVGVGSGGQFNPKTGHCLGINTGDPRFIGFPIGERLAAALNLPVCIDNDVKMAAFGELRLGAGRDFQDLLCVAVGTGIGGALILGGKLFHGHSGLAGHLGLFPDAQSGIRIEAIAGGVPLGNIALARGILAVGETTERLFNLARSGNTDAAALIREAAASLGRVLAGLSYTVQPEAILIGGSVGLQPEYVQVIDEMLRLYMLPAWQTIRVIPMTLGTDAGMIGAGLCAREMFN